MSEEQPMELEKYFSGPAHQTEKETLKVIHKVIERFARERPLEGVRAVAGHLIARNSITMVEALWRGGAQVVLCNPYPSARSDSLFADLAENGFPVSPVDEAVRVSDFFMDNGGALVQRRTPRAAAEVTRTGELYYRDKPCPVISVDRSRVKHLEDFLGTGESLVRAWQQLRPDDPLGDKHLVQFGFGKVGRGVARHARLVGMRVTIVDVDPAARARAEEAGFTALDAEGGDELRSALAQADVVAGVTGIPGAVGRTVPPEWLRANRPALVNIGYDEFGPSFDDAEIVGGSSVPINFHLARPTRNRYIDPALAAQVLAIEALVRHPDRYADGIHALPAEIDEWVLRTWRNAWPDEDLGGLAEELGI
jgi:adenosylhomocysteinase